MLSHKELEKEVKKKYNERLKNELNKKNPNSLEISFLQAVIKRIDEGKLFN